MAQLKYQVFLCFRGEDVRVGFLSFLTSALERKSIKYYVDYKETRGELMDIFLQRIAESRIVLVILSHKFMESNWCVDEVLKALETREAGTSIIPIFYKVKAADVKNWSLIQDGKRDKFINVTKHLGLRSKDYPTSEARFVDKIVEEVEKALTKLETEEKETKGSNREGNKLKMEPVEITTTTMPFFGIKKRVKQLQEKLKMELPAETRLVGLVGMKCVGKTKLAESLLEDGQGCFLRRMLFKDTIGKNLESEKKRGLLVKQFQKNLLKISNTDETKGTKLLLVLDDFIDKEDIVCLLGDRGWITPGSKIVIVASDKSLVEGLVDDTYLVPGLNDKEGLACLSYHAFGDATRCDSDEGNLRTLSRRFLDYARGNPLALSSLGKELCGRGEDQWLTIHEALATSQNKNVQDLFKSCYDCLNQRQKDAFLDVTCFFLSQDHKFVETLVDSSCGGIGRSIVKDLADKFLIEISGGRVEMHGLIYALGKNLASQDQWRLWKQQEIIQALEKKLDFVGAVRGIFLDMSEVAVTRALGQKPFDGMKELRYLKFYNSCIRFLESDSKLNFPEGLDFSLQEVRYLHWLKFPFEELPRNFNPKNLVDLKLPYSNIKRLWDCAKDVTNLKWVDLSHSINLEELSGLSGAGNLQRLNLEGCTGLENLPKEMMETLTSLVFLNLRSCTGLKSLTEVNVKSLKTLILINCYSLKRFQIILENLEALYLDGTALKELPEATKYLKKLVILSLKDCTKLASVHDSLGKLQALQELILSGCYKLKSFPDVEENMKRLRILLLDGTAINKVPQLFPSGMNGLSLLRRLCLSGNVVIQTLQAHIGQLYHLRCLDLKDCKKLISLPVLPPNLECLDAHGCDLLTTVANPLAFLNLTDQIHSTFLFSQCNNLDEVSKSYIISYIQKKSQLMSSALNRYNLSYVMESYTGACFPGCEVPEWFECQDYGPKIEKALCRHRSENRVIGVALCAAVSFRDYRDDQISGFFVKCTCEFKNADGSLIRRLRCTVGGTSGPGMEPRNIESDHVFISFTSLLQIKKQSGEEDEKACSSTTASLEFEVINGAGELVKCEVIKCGFSMVYEPEGTDHDNVSWEVSSDESPVVDDESFSDDEPMSFSTQEADVISIDGQGSDSDEGQHEEQEEACVSLEDNSNADSDENMDDEASSIIAATTETQHECNSGGIENVNGEDTRVSTPSTQDVATMTPESYEVIIGDGNTTCFSFLQRFIPCLENKTT